jgi:hypothetical protein
MSDSAVTIGTDPGTQVAIIDLKSLVPSDLAKAQEIAKGIKVDDSSAIMQYGMGAQTKISGFADSMLNQIRSKDAGDVGESLSNLMFKIKDVDVGGLTSDHHGIFQTLLNKVEHFMAKYEKLETQIDKIIDELNNSRMTLLCDITMLVSLNESDLRTGLDGNHPGELEIVELLGEAFESLHKIVELLCLDWIRRSLGSCLHLGKNVGIEVIELDLTSGNENVEIMKILGVFWKS